MNWIPVSKKQPCPICKKTDWCSLSSDGRKVVCPRIRSNVYLKGAGFLHKVEYNGVDPKEKVSIKRRSNMSINWKALSQLYEKKLSYDKGEQLSIELGVAMRYFPPWHVGWDSEAWTIPAYNGDREMVGIQRRFPDGEKLWVSRSKNGLFIPEMKNIWGAIFITEGFSDGIAVSTLGARVIGRPNCQTGVGFIKRFIHINKNVREVVVVSDNDTVGVAGSARLMREISAQVTTSRVIVPEDYKDARKWIEAGATLNDLIERRLDE